MKSIRLVMEDIRQQFNDISEQYDSQRRQLIPCFDDFYGLPVKNLILSTPEPKILDLGTGTGLLAQYIFEKYPASHLRLVDLSEKMLDVARKRFAGLPGVMIEQIDFKEIEIPVGMYDAIISSLAIHHIDDETKKKLYAKVYAGLKAGGIFFNAEQILGETPQMQAIYRKHMWDNVQRSGLSEVEIEVAYKRAELDQCATVSDQLDWLREIGFSQVDCIYKYYDFAVLWAEK